MQHSQCGFSSQIHRHGGIVVLREGAMFELSEFKGNKVIVLKKDENDKYAFTFGIAKARMVVQHIEDIKKFVEDNGG